MEIKSLSDFRKAMLEGAYAWPGGYPCYFITSDGSALSFETARKERREIIAAIVRNDNNGWRVCAKEVNWEDDALYCDHSGEEIECAYSPH